MTVEDLARRSGVAASTVRFYARAGLLRPSRDPSNGYRRFDEDDVRRLNFIVRAKQLAFSLPEIKRIMNTAERGFPSSPAVRTIVERRVEENRRRIDELVALQAQVERTLAAWESRPDAAPDARSLGDLIDSLSLFGGPHEAASLGRPERRLRSA
jgi:DNA-binding transcriptional MerR regulator